MCREEEKKPKVVIVTGPPLVGKTKYIRGNYANAPGFYHFDFVSEYKTITGGLDDFPESENAIEVYNSIMDKLVDAVLFGKKDMIFEYCTGYAEMDEALVDLINLIKASGTEVALVQLSAELDTVMQRKEAVLQDPDYVSSYYTNEPAFEILSNFFEDLSVNKKAVGS
jgi:hypothetical protein